jgi:glutamate synthase domain-containing protein 3
LSEPLRARELGYRRLNDLIRERTGEIGVEDCFGERFIGSGASGKNIVIHGTPGNALGAYLDGAEIHVHGNAQDAVGDTMNGGRIVIHGNAGDALGYAMRGGEIYVRGDAGYRTGIHMKQYQDKRPVIVVGGAVGSFLGEYLAGGLIVVLGLGGDGEPPVGRFTGTGMHGGRIFLRCRREPDDLPAQVLVQRAGEADLAEIAGPLRAFAACFGLDAAELLTATYYALSPNAKNPYRQLYTEN